MPAVQRVAVLQGACSVQEICQYPVQDEHHQTPVFEVIALLTGKGFLDGKDPPLEKIYEEIIGKFGYIGRGSLHYGFNAGFLLFLVFFWRLIR